MPSTAVIDRLMKMINSYRVLRIGDILKFNANDKVYMFEVSDMNGKQGLSISRSSKNI